MTVFADRGATVNRLRIRCGGIDPLLARLRAGRLLDESAIQPATLPPSAILCIRRLSDPRPGLVALDGAQPVPALWTEAVAASVRDMARSASRPGLGDMTTGAEAVLFADRAEMLACLAADWCAGELNARWWWRALLGEIGEARSVLRAWLKAPEYIAAALDELAGRGGATAFVARLEEADTRALLEAVIVQHDLRWLVPPLEQVTRAKRPLPTSLTAGDGYVAEANADRNAPAVGALLRAPWTERVPESRPRSLRVDQQCLLGIALMTRRAPTIVRTSRFAAQVRRWFETSDGDGSAEPGTSDRAPAPSHDEPPIERRPLIERVDHHAGPSAARTKDGDTAPPPIAQTGPAGAHALKSTEPQLHAGPAVKFLSFETDLRSTGARGTAESVARDSEPRVLGPELSALRSGAATPLGQMPVDRRDPAARVPERSAERGTANVDAAASSIAPPSITPPTAPVLVTPSGRPIAASSTSYERAGTDHDQAIAARFAPNESTAPLPVPRIYPASIETEVGGVFYLLNVALRLGLYGDFTTPAQPGIGLSIWDFLTLAGRALTPRQFQRDSVWALFADLAGRAPDETPGATFDPPDEWRLPTEWLDAFPEGGTWRWSERAGRLRVVHPAGFAIVDVPRADDKDVVEQLERELSTYRSVTSLVTRRAAARGGVSPGLTWWMGCLMPYVRARLARAVGISLPKRAGALVCVQRSRVTTTPTHVDVFFLLAELPIEVRLSGLDRNPGWVPAADRVIAFHYD